MASGDRRLGGEGQTYVGTVSPAGESIGGKAQTVAGARGGFGAQTVRPVDGYEKFLSFSRFSLLGCSTGQRLCPIRTKSLKRGEKRERSLRRFPPVLS